MAARKNKVQHELLNRLELFANNKVKMTSAQVIAAKVVIGKSIPDLKAIEHSGKDESPTAHSIKVHFVDSARRNNDDQR